MERRFAVGCAIVVIALAVVGVASPFLGGGYEARLARWSLIPHEPAEVLERFYAYEGAEDQLLDPLVLGGTEVVPLVNSSVENRDMARRLYALTFLGIAGSATSGPVLVRISRDPSELTWVRFAAVKALYRIDKERAGQIAQELLDREPMDHWEEQGFRSFREDLQRMTRRTLDSSWTRTWLDALRGRHD